MKKSKIASNTSVRIAPAAPGHSIHYIFRIVLALTLVVFVYEMGRVLLDYVRYAVWAVGYPFPLDYGEGPVLDQTVRMANFENIYRDFSSPPYTISNYTPFFMTVQVPLYWLFGPALWYGRVISILCVLVTSFFIFSTIFTLSRDWFGSTIGGLLLITFPYVQKWSLFSRVDELALALSWAALYVTVRYIGQKDDGSLQKRSFWLATLLFVASIYTRQTYALAGPFTAAVWLVFGTPGTRINRIRLSVKLLLTIACLSLALFLLINILTGGGFYRNVVFANINAFHWETVRHYIEEIWYGFYPLLILAGLFLIAEPWINKERSRIWPLVLSYLAASAISSLTIGKIGSSINYLLEFSAALSLAGGAAAAAATRLKSPGKTVLRIVIIAALAFQLSITAEWRRDLGNYLAHFISRKDKIADVARIVKDAPGIVLADEQMSLISLAGKRLYFEPFGFKQLSDAGLLDQTPLVADIRDRKFDVILWYGPQSWPAVESRWTPAQRSMVLSTYKLDIVIDDIYVFRPKSNK